MMSRARDDADGSRSGKAVFFRPYQEQHNIFSCLIQQAPRSTGLATIPPYTNIYI